MRRCWSVQTIESESNKRWIAQDVDGNWFYDAKGKRLEFGDPFTALVEADKWFAENIEKEGRAS